ncbi:hypothetical protein BDP27DRAFT_1424543 [Rhodocollybia butyracea]|uniref:Uncharacterized protein n=1 Tax=Rhodocollybia butyracea TaxID=206335 RepID=A0A9P5PKZ5_9AGAR|nr:hypothetical protein BDP27DRAFT_1424543 [Rhodocollybia butyracea]
MSRTSYKADPIEMQSGKSSSVEPESSFEPDQEDQKPHRRSPSPGWLDGWDVFNENNIHSMTGTHSALSMLREYSMMSFREFEAVVGLPQEADGFAQYTSPEEMERLLERGDLLDEMHRQIKNCLAERDTAVRYANAARLELFRLRQELIVASEALLETTNKLDNPFLQRDVNKLAVGLMEHGRKGSRDREQFEMQARRRKPFPQQSVVQAIAAYPTLKSQLH